MAAPPEEALSRAVNALYRIRAIERPPDADGLRSVWHQCAEGADLVSYVDTKGHVVRQELTLLVDHFRWTSQHGLITGEVADAPGSKASAASSDLSLDAEISPERVRRAAAALGAYKGEDRYIRNMQRVLNLVLTGLQSFDEPTVTRSATHGEVMSAAAAPPARSLVPIAVGASLLLLGVAILAMILIGKAS